MSGGVDAKKLGRPRKEPTQVKYTGDWSLDSKTCSISNGYWEDPFLSFFNKVDAIPRRTSLICRGYYVRFRVCDFFLRSILDAAGEPIQILSVGAGMDTSFFRLLPQFENQIAKFFELDFESTILKKKQVIESSELLHIMADEKLVLLSADIRNISSLNEILASAGFQHSMPTLIFSECVVNYLQPNESEALLKWMVDHIPRCIWLAYEQCYPHDSFGKVMMKHFDKNGCSLLSLPRNPDMKAQKQQLQNVGFQVCKSFNAFDSFLYLTRNETSPFPKISISNGQQFDEYEALLATCLHYSVRIGTCGDVGSISEFLKSTSSAISRLREPKFDQDTTILTYSNNDASSNDIVTFTSDKKLSGHAALSLKANEILLLGGTKSSSCRSTSLDRINIMSCCEQGAPSQLTVEVIKDDRRYFERIHSSVVFHEPTSSFYIFGGRMSPQEPCCNDLIQVHSKFPYTLKSLSFAKESCPTPRWRSSMVAASNSLIVFGGKNEVEIFGDCWIFQFCEGHWKEKKWTRMPCPRHSHSMAVDSRRQHAYCIGGILEDDTTLSLDAVWKYDFSDSNEESWTNLPNLSIYGRRIGHASVIHNDILFIVGGYPANSGYSLLHFATLINLDNNAIRVFDLEPPSPTNNNLFIPFGCSVTVIKRTNEDDSQSELIVVYGGGENLFSFGSYYNDVHFIIPLNSEIFSFS